MPFRAWLRSRRTGRDDGAETRAGASVGLALGPPEGGRPAPLPLAERVSVRAATAPAEVTRLLVGQGQAAREARIQLGGGPLAGSSIHLTVTPAGVEARVGAPTEAARLALAGVLDRVGLHLRSRGIVMRPGASLDTGSRHDQRGGRGRR
jgi:hypothetical protein